MNTKKGMSCRWILLPILFSSVSVLAGGFGGGEAPSATDQAVALSAEEDGFLDDMQETGSGSMTYIGGQSRIGVGFDTEFKGRVDGSHIFQETEDSVTSGEGWIGINPTAEDDEEVLTGVGAKINHHWVTRDGAGNPLHVNKVFGAYDQNEAKDKKVTAGYGQEFENMFWSGHVSKGLSDMRASIESGVYEKAFDYGVGGRVGAFVGDQLMRVQGGLDYEWGTEHNAAEDTPSQLSISGGVEKFFPDSPHSIGANIEVSKQDGGYIGDDHEADISGNVSYRYDFGGAGLFASDEQYRRVRVEIPGKTEVIKIKKKRPPKVERKLVKHTMELEADTFFKKGDHQLTHEAQQRLRAMFAQIRQSGHQGRIRIVGNTCDLGSHQNNQSLSERRAAQVRNFMVASGFNANELMAVGLGETQPKYPNTDATRHRNRRVDIEYVAYQNNYKDEVIEQGYDIEEKTRVISEPRVVWRKELIPSPPSWVGQALRNNIQYKQRIDTYRTLGTDGGIDIGGGNSFPVLKADEAVTAINESVMIDVLANDTDPDGDRLTISNHDTSTANGGVITLQVETGKLIYAPAADFEGTDTFTYTASDGNGNITEGTVTVIVGNGGDGGTGGGSTLVASDDHISTAINTQVTVDVLANDSDTDGDTVSILSAADNSENGGAIIQQDGQLVFTPATDFVGTDSFVYTITDGNGNEANATVTVTVGDAGGSLVAVADSKSTEVDTPVALDVLANDSDADGDTISIESFDSTSANGGTIVSEDGFLVFTPAAGFTGTDTFSYTITDNNGETAGTTVTITVGGGGAQTGLVAVDDSKTTQVDTPVAVDVLANDSDTDGDTITIEVFDSTSANGGTIVAEDGLLVFTPAAGFTGTDTFLYAITDNNGESATATVTILVQDSNGSGSASASRPVDDSITVAPEETDGQSEVSIDVLGNDTVDGAASIKVMSHPAQGSIQNVDGSGVATSNQVVYAPNENATGVDNFTYVLVDSEGNASASATVTITLPGNNGGGSNGNGSALNLTDDGTQGELPGDTYSFYANDTATRSLDVLSNDSGDGMEIIAITTGPRFGSASISSDGQSINYSLRSGYCEDHHLVYRVRDQYGNEAEAKVFINVLDDTQHSE